MLRGVGSILIDGRILRLKIIILLRAWKQTLLYITEDIR
jgi:hypothetical protein